MIRFFRLDLTIFVIIHMPDPNWHDFAFCSLVPLANISKMDTKRLIESISENTENNKEETARLMNHFIEIVSDSLKDGDIISIPSIGNFETKMRAERYAVHPSTGKKLLVPPKLSVIFKPSTILKQKIRWQHERENYISDTGCQPGYSFR